MPSFMIIGLLVRLKVFTIYRCGGHLCHVTCFIYINFLSPFSRRLNINLHLIGQAARGGGRQPPWVHCFHCQIYLVVCCRFSPIKRLNNSPAVIQLDLAFNYGQGQPRFVSYINFVELVSLMLHAKLTIIGALILEKKIFKGFNHIQAWRLSLSCGLEQLYKLHYPIPRRLHMKFDIAWPSGF